MQRKKMFEKWGEKKICIKKAMEISDLMVLLSGICGQFSCHHFNVCSNAIFIWLFSLFFSLFGYWCLVLLLDAIKVFLAQQANIYLNVFFSALGTITRCRFICPISNGIFRVSFFRSHWMCVRVCVLVLFFSSSFCWLFRSAEKKSARNFMAII